MTLLMNDPYARLFDDIMGELTHGTHPTDKYSSFSDKDNYTIEMPLIAVKKEEMSVKVEENCLIIEAKPTKSSKFAKQCNIKFVLREDADTDNISAQLENGLLTVKVPRVKQSKKLINIDVV